MSEINKLTQFNTTKAPRASSLKLPAASQKAPSQISSKKMFFTISYKNDDWR